MKFYIFTLFFALLVATAFAVTAQKAVLISYPGDTPEFFIDQAMKVIEDAGGVITHEFKLIKGFAAKASTKALESVTALGDTYIPVIEEDAIVSIDGDLVGNGHTN